MLAWYLLWPCVRLSVISWCFIKMAERIKIVFGVEATLGSPKIRVLPSGTLSQTLDSEKFLHGTSTMLSVVSLVQLTTTFVYKN